MSDFSDKFTNARKLATAPKRSDSPRAQPPDVNGKELVYSKPFTRQERENARRLIRIAKQKAGLDVPDKPVRAKSKPTPRRPMAELLQISKACYEYYDERDCGEPWDKWKDKERIKCHWCERFEYERNERADEDGPKQMLEE